MNKFRVGARLFIDAIRINLPALAKTVLQPKNVILPKQDEPIEVYVSNQVVEEVSEHFLSFTIDIAQVVGGRF